MKHEIIFSGFFTPGAVVALLLLSNMIAPGVTGLPVLGVVARSPTHQHKIVDGDKQRHLQTFEDFWFDIVCNGDTLTLGVAQGFESKSPSGTSCLCFPKNYTLTCLVPNICFTSQNGCPATCADITATMQWDERLTYSGRVSQGDVGLKCAVYATLSGEGEVKCNSCQVCEGEKPVNLDCSNILSQSQAVRAIKCFEDTFEVTPSGLSSQYEVGQYLARIWSSTANLFTSPDKCPTGAPLTYVPTDSTPTNSIPNPPVSKPTPVWWPTSAPSGDSSGISFGAIAGIVLANAFFWPLIWSYCRIYGRRLSGVWRLVLRAIPFFAKHYANGNLDVIPGKTQGSDGGVDGEASPETVAAGSESGGVDEVPPPMAVDEAAPVGVAAPRAP